MISSRTAAARTKLMELGWRAGYPLNKILDYYPAVTSIGFEAKFIYTQPTLTPDDDVAVAIDGRIVYDLQRRAGVYKPPIIIQRSEKTPLRVGAWVEVLTFDGNRVGVAHVEWRITIAYSDGLAVSIAGGSRDRWTLSGTGARYDYYPNGSFLIPPPANWPRPTFLPLKHHRPTFASRALAAPTPNPIF